MHEHHGHDHLDEDEYAACAQAITNVHAFLHGDLPEAEADEIREHLMVCEACLDDFDVEEAISALIKRCNPPMEASVALRAQVSAMRVSVTTYQVDATE